MKRTVKALSKYMQARAAFEGVKWELTEAYLQEHFNHGIRTFFGVEVDVNGKLVSDDQQPAFFAKYRRSERS